MSLSDTLRKQTRTLVLPGAIVLTLVIGYLDYLTHREWSFFMFYAVPILMVAWRGNLKLALAVAVLCGAAWFWAHSETHPYKSLTPYVWAAINRLAYFLFVAIGGTALRHQREEMRARLEASQRARALEHEIVRVSEREQMRIGQDLHDGLCQNLAAIDCAVACLKTDLAAAARPEARAAEAIQVMLKEAVTEARDVARGIAPVHNDANDLAAVLDELARTTSRAGAVTAHFAQSGEVPRTAPQVSLNLCRIAQEAVRNAIKHAQASRVDLELRSEGNDLHLTIADDGRGFSGTPSTSSGMGLGTMRYRARLIDAELTVIARTGGGTLVTCRLPLNSANNHCP